MYLLCVCVLQPLSFSWFNGARLRECPKISWNWLAGWLAGGCCYCYCPRNLYVLQWLYNRNMCYAYLLHYTHIFSLWWHWCHFNLGFSCTHLASKKEWNLRELHFVYRFTYTISSFFHVEWVCARVYVLERARFFDYEIKCFPNGCEHNFFHFHVKNGSKQSAKAAKHFSIKCTQNFLSFAQRTPFFLFLILSHPYLSWKSQISSSSLLLIVCCFCWNSTSFNACYSFGVLCAPGPRKSQKC